MHFVGWVLFPFGIFLGFLLGSLIGALWILAFSPNLAWVMGSPATGAGMTAAGVLVAPHGKSKRDCCVN